jgi:hypothetical protein
MRRLRSLRAAQKARTFHSEVTSALQEIAEAEESARQINSQLKSGNSIVKFTPKKTEQIRQAIETEEKIILAGSNLSRKLSRKATELADVMQGKNAKQISEATGELAKVMGIARGLTKKIEKARESLERNKGLLRVAESKTTKKASAHRAMNVLFLEHRKLQGEIATGYKNATNVEMSIRRDSFTQLEKEQAARTAIKMQDAIGRKCEKFIRRLEKESTRPEIGDGAKEQISMLIKQYEKQWQFYKKSASQNISRLDGLRSSRPRASLPEVA